MWIVVLGETLCDAQQGIIRHFIWKNLRTKFFYQFIVVETNQSVDGETPANKFGHARCR